MVVYGDDILVVGTETLNYALRVFFFSSIINN